MAKRLFKIFRGILLGLVVVYGACILLLGLPVVQRQLTILAEQELEKLLGTEMSIGHITIGYPNRVILENVAIDDLQGERLLEVARLSAKFEWMPLLQEGRIAIRTAQIFGLHARLNRPTPDGEDNFQFILDALASKDTTQQKTPLDLRVNSILVRHGQVRYDVLSAPATPGVFNAGHIAFKNIHANIALKALQNDSLNLSVKRFELEEQSGLRVEALRFRLVADTHRLSLSDFDLRLPATRLYIGALEADYPHEEGTDPMEKLHIKGSIGSGSHLTPGDLSSFVPALQHFHEALNIRATFDGTSQRMEIPRLQISSRKNEVQLLLEEAVATREEGALPYLHTELRRASANAVGLALLYRNFTGSDKLPDELRNLDHVHFAGETEGDISHIKLHGLLETGIGNVQTHAALHLLPERRMAYEGKLLSDGLDLKTLLGEKQKLGKLSLAVEFKGKHDHGQTPSVYLQGSLPELQYSGYTYRNIHTDGTFGKNGFDGVVSLDDPNASLLLRGKVDLLGQVPAVNLTAEVAHFRPHDLALTTDREGYEYNLKLRAHFKGNNPDNLEGELAIDSLSAITPDDFYYMERLQARAETVEGKKDCKRLTVESDFMQATVEGRYAYRTLPASFTHMVNRYLPSLVNLKPSATRKGNRPQNDFTFSLRLENSNFYPYILGLPLKVHSPATVSGYVNDAEGIMSLEGSAPHFHYGKSEYEGGSLRCDNLADEVVADVRFSKRMSGNSHLTMSMLAKGADDCLSTRLFWGNNTEVTYCGSLEAETKFSRTPSSPYLRADIHVKPSEIILNDTVWNLHESFIRIDSGFVDIDRFKVEHDEKHLIVDGRLAPSPADTLTADLKHIDVEYILDIVQFHSVEFEGKATGKAYVSGAFGEMEAKTHLRVEDFRFNGGRMGDMEVDGRWDKELGVVLDADIREGEQSRTTVQGNISPMANGLDLRIGADHTNLDFLNSFLGGIFSRIGGETSGFVHLHGPFKALNLEGDVLANATAHVKVLDTSFSLVNDSVRLRDGYIEFPNAVIQDPEGHRGMVNGRVTHTHLGQIGYDFRIHTDHMLCYNTKDFGDQLFYASAYATGDFHLWGGGNRLTLEVNAETEPGTLFVYNMSSPEEIADSRFVTFVDKTPRPTVEVRPLRLFTDEKDEEEDDDGTPLQVIITGNIEVKDDADVRVLMDTRSGDYVAVHGTGSFPIVYDSSKGITLRGTYKIEGGVYKMSMQEVIRKDLIIQPESELTFTGMGADADLSLKTIYTVNSASLSDLVPDATFNQNTVKVNCLINLTGKLAAPVLSFDIDLPTVNDEEMQLVRSAISTDEQMRMQILYLLGVGKFYTYDYANTEGRSSSDAMSSLLSSTLSGQLNNILSQAIDMSNWNFSGNFSTGQEGWSDLEVEGILSGRLLNNRLLINGNFGYRENQLANSNFVGDFNLQWLLTPSGEIRLKAYNQTNDRYFAKTTFNTQGIGIIYKREFDRWRDFFKKKRTNVGR